MGVPCEATEVVIDDEVESSPPPDESSLRAKRPSFNESVYSVTSAKTSFSQEEISELDSELMIETLPNLLSATDGVLNLLLPTDLTDVRDVLDKLHAGDTRFNRLAANRLGIFKIHRREFGSTDFIRCDIVLRALLKVDSVHDIPDDAWRPDSVLIKSNLAVMIQGLFEIRFEDLPTGLQTYDHLELLEADFTSAIAAASFSERAFTTYLRLTIQLCIGRLQTNMPVDSFEAHGIVNRTIFDHDFRNEGSDTFSVQHLDALRVSEADPDTQNRCTDAVRAAVTVLHDAIDTHPRNLHAAIDHMKTSFPWDDFIDDVAEYAAERKEDLDAQIAAAGGINEISRSLAAQVERASARKELELKRKRLSDHGLPRQKPLTGLRMLRARAKELAQSSAPTPNSRSVVEARETPLRATAPAVQMPAAVPDVFEDEWIAPDDEEDIADNEEVANPVALADDHAIQEGSPKIISRQSLVYLTEFQQQQRQNAAKASSRFIDRQEGARRVSWDDDVESQQRDERSHDSRPHPEDESARRAGKRKAQEELDEPDDFEPTQDEGFQVDHRDMSVAAERRRLAPQHSERVFRLPSATRAATSPSAAASSAAPVEAHSPARPTPAPAPPASARKNPGSAIPRPPPSRDPDANDLAEMSTAEQYKIAKWSERQTAARLRSTKPQVRTPWTEEETVLLVELIEKYGIAWTLIKSIVDADDEYEPIRRREAEQMRVKARDLHVMYLLGGNPLPPNFELVPLDLKALRKLESAGIQHERSRLRAERS